MKKFTLLFILFIAAATPIAVFAKDLMLTCEENFCKGSIAQQRKAFTALRKTMHLVEKKLQTPIPSTRKPIEVHVGYNSKCEKGPAGSTHYKTNGQAIICLDTTLNKIIKGHTAFAHELTHTYFDIEKGSHGENFEEVLVRAVTPCIKNCGEKGASRPKSLCSVAELMKKTAQFCKEYDLEYEKIPLLLKRLAEIRKDHRVTNDQLIQELKSISLPN